jgi:hypothetical protein
MVPSQHHSGISSFAVYNLLDLNLLVRAAGHRRRMRYRQVPSQK